MPPATDTSGGCQIFAEGIPPADFLGWFMSDPMLGLDWEEAAGPSSLTTVWDGSEL